MPSCKISVNPEDNSFLGLRLDQYIVNLGILSRSQIKTLNLQAIQEGKILKLSHKVSSGMNLELVWDEVKYSNDLKPFPLDLNIIYEDNNCIVINKEQGVVVHPGHGHCEETLIQGVLYRYKDMESLISDDTLRPGIVHRLDKDTSGAIIIARNVETLQFLSHQFSEKTAQKTYIALVKGVPKRKNGTIKSYIKRSTYNRKIFTVSENSGKYAETDYITLKSWNGYSLLKVYPRTGRTHQIRVHLKDILNTPILGDTLYARKDKNFPDINLMLHSYKLAILINKETRKRFKASCPRRFHQVIETLNEINGEYVG